MNVVQAGAGGHVFERDPEFARQALQNIETSGRRALADLDRILGLLREDGDGVERAPQPGLEGIAALVADVGELGVPIELHVTGPTDEVPAVVGRSAYRIVQEALTNVVRHAGRTSTRVAVQHGASALELEIVNDRPEAGLGHDIAPAAGGGRGLTGIRERVGLLGGTVDTGPRPDGGFRVWASLPLSGSGS
jgi:signal transduction histidine kinase